MEKLLEKIIISLIFFGGAMILFFDRVVYSNWPHLFYKYKKVAWFIAIGFLLTSSFLLIYITLKR